MNPDDSRNPHASVMSDSPAFLNTWLVHRKLSFLRSIRLAHAGRTANYQGPPRTHRT
jgi:hypothetical protein